jgi:hypothetical protein
MKNVTDQKDTAIMQHNARDIAKPPTFPMAASHFTPGGKWTAV